MQRTAKFNTSSKGSLDAKSEEHRRTKTGLSFSLTWGHTENTGSRLRSFLLLCMQGSRKGDVKCYDPMYIMASLEMKDKEAAHSSTDLTIPKIQYLDTSI